jgi:hypothetical protein
MKNLLFLTILILALSCTKEQDFNIYPLQGIAWRVAQSEIIIPGTTVVLLHDRVTIAGNEYPAIWLDFGTIITDALPCSEIALTADPGKGEGYLLMKDCAGNRVYLVRK